MKLWPMLPCRTLRNVGGATRLGATCKSESLRTLRQTATPPFCKIGSSLIKVKLRCNWKQIEKWLSLFLLLSLHHITDTIKPCLKEPPHIHKTRQDQVARVARAWQELEGLGRMITCRWSPRVDDHLRAVVMPNINTETQIQIQIQGKSGSQWDDHRSGWSLVGGGDATQGTPGSRWAKRIGAGQAR